MGRETVSVCVCLLPFWLPAALVVAVPLNEELSPSSALPHIPHCLHHEQLTAVLVVLVLLLLLPSIFARWLQLLLLPLLGELLRLGGGGGRGKWSAAMVAAAAAAHSGGPRYQSSGDGSVGHSGMDRGGLRAGHSGGGG